MDLIFWQDLFVHYGIVLEQYLQKCPYWTRCLQKCVLIKNGLMKPCQDIFEASAQVGHKQVVYVALL